MHITDWFPTFMELAGCKNKNYGGKPLDGVSFFPALWSDVDEPYALRNEILHAMNPVYVAQKLRDPRGNWKVGIKGSGLN